MITPLNNRVIVKQTDVEVTSEGGIVLPSAEQDKPTTGQVIACTKNDEVEVGDVVLFSKYAGTEMKVSGQAVLVLKLDELVAKL